MDILRIVGLMLLALTVLIVVHELGHFWAAKIFKMRVEEFALFFGKKLWGFKRGETEWRINAVPLGGYVKISGMIDESLDEKQVAGEPQPWEFRSKPTWQRLIVMLGGIIMNLILGCIIFIAHKYLVGDVKIPMKNLQYGILVSDSSAMWNLGFRTGDQIVSYVGEEYPYFDDYADPNKLVDRGKYFDVRHEDGQTERIAMPDDFLDAFHASKERMLFSPDMEAELYVLDTTLMAQAEKEGVDTADFSIQAFRAGIRTGDRVIQVDSVPIRRYSEFLSYMQNKPNQTIRIIVDRKNKEIPFEVLTKANSKVGVTMNQEILGDTVLYTFGQSIPLGIASAFSQVTNTLKGLRAIFTGNADPSKSLSGPVAIAGYYGKVFKSGGWSGFWLLTGMLSMVLAVMNLLPIPVLDGGQVLILIIEAVIGREIPTKAKLIILQIGFYLVVGLMAFAILNDVLKLF